jgi:Mg/Co/Ni transporter MgtE
VNKPDTDLILELQAFLSQSEEESESIFRVARFRLPWLLVCLAGTQLSTLVLSFAMVRGLCAGETSALQRTAVL